MRKRLILVLVIVAVFSGAFAKAKSLNFENPGNRRLLKSEAGNHWYYRSLPEKSLTLNVEGVSTIQLRSFALENLRKPNVYTIINKEKTAWDLSLNELQDGYYLYNELAIPIPDGTKSIEILCYDRSLYFRAFHTPKKAPNHKQPAKPANMVVKAHGGSTIISHNGTDSSYYVFNQSQSLKFTLNNGRNAIIYVRARLLDRSLPVFDLYMNGELLQSHEFTLRRTTKYTAVGVDHLTTGLKLELPPNSSTAEIELRAKSDHMFFARPVLQKKQ